MRNKYLSLVMSVSICAAFTFVVACETNKGRYLTAEGDVWHTQWHITYRSVKDLRDSVTAVMDSVDRSLSFFNPASCLSLLNRAEKCAPADPMMRDVYTLSRRIWKMSDGMFDPTVSPAVTAWGFGRGHSITPDTLALDSLRQFVGFDKTKMEKDIIFKNDPRTEFNFSAVAKGYGVDRVAAMLERNGVQDYLLEIGGEIRASGMSPSGKDWRVAVTDPTSENEEKSIIDFTDMGMATSGNYRNRQKTAGGTSVGHTVSPISLKPVATDILSATVMAPSCAEADALATAAMVMGSKHSIQLLDSLGFPALLILEDMTVVRNRAMLELENKKK